MCTRVIFTILTPALQLEQPIITKCTLAILVGLLHFFLAFPSLCADGVGWGGKEGPLSIICGNLKES